MEGSLAKKSSAQLEIKKPLSKTQRTLVGLLDLAAKATHYEMGSGELRLWEPLLDYSESDLTAAFKQYFLGERCTFMPEPGQIKAIIREMQETRGRQRAWQATDQQLAENRAARETGKTVSFKEVLKRFAEVAAKKAM